MLLAAFSIASGEASRTMLFWMMGSLADATPGKVATLAPYALAGAAVLLAAAGRLNLFAVGEESAAALGVDTERTKRVVFLAASLLTGAAVAFAGVIGFVGLLVPHGVRAIAGNDQRTLLPLSALAGRGPARRGRRRVPRGPRAGGAADRRDHGRARRAALRVAAAEDAVTAGLIEARGLTADYGASRALDGLDASDCGRARSSRSWARTDPASRRC